MSDRTTLLGDRDHVASLMLLVTVFATMLLTYLDRSRIGRNSANCSIGQDIFELLL